MSRTSQPLGLLPLLAAGVCTLGGLGTAQAQQPDWLAAWPPCAIDQPSTPSLSILYPSEQLPALVMKPEPSAPSATDASNLALTARVRVPAALTPPPGVQQERALTSFSGELSGWPLRAGVSDRARQHYALPVVSVRPDAAGTLVYRVRLELPAYLPPGTYSFALRTPFGVRYAPDAVRVVGARGPRIARLPEGASLPPASTSGLPIDVWIASEEKPGRRAPELELVPATSEPELRAPSPAPVLRTSSQAFALRVGSELWTRSQCAAPAGFDRELNALARAEGRERVELTAALTRKPASDDVPRTPAPGLTIEPGSVRVDARQSAQTLEYSLLLPFAAAISVDRGELELFPATDPGMREPESKLARWLVPPRTAARLTIGAALHGRGRSDLRLEPVAARTGQHTRVTVRGADARARVAFVLGFARTAYGAPSVLTSFAGPLQRPVQAQVFSADGIGRAAHGHVWVQPQRPPTCASLGPQAGRGPSRRSEPLSMRIAVALLYGLACLLKARAIRRARRKGATQAAPE